VGIQPLKTEYWGAGVVDCLERGADLHMAQRIPLPLTVSCSSKIQTAFTFLVLTHLVSPGQRVAKWVCATTCVLLQSLIEYNKAEHHESAWSMNSVQ